MNRKCELTLNFWLLSLEQSGVFTVHSFSKPDCLNSSFIANFEEQSLILCSPKCLVRFIFCVNYLKITEREQEDLVWNVWGLQAHKLKSYMNNWEWWWTLKIMWSDSILIFWYISLVLIWFFFYEQSVWMASTVELLEHPPSEAALGRTLSEILASVKTSDMSFPSSAYNYAFITNANIFNI